MANWFFRLFVSCYFLHQLWETVLTLLNNAHLQRHRDQTPDYFKDKIAPDRYQKGIEYNLERARFGLVIRWISVVVTWGVIVSGVFNQLDQWLETLALNELVHSLAYCGAVALALLVMSLPASLYSQFVIEQKYGFNKMTATTFVMDRFKSLVLGLLLGAPLLALIFWFYQASGPSWWLWAFAALFGFEFLIAAVYPTLLAPIFNKFTPLADGSLKAAILQLARKINFKLSGIYTIDGSKRSSHSNAYFSGMGRMRRIVLFDTLQSQLSEAEILAVLGHEMGHNKKRHVQKQLLLSFFISLIGFWILSRVIDWQPFYSAFNAGLPTPAKGLVLAALFGSHFSFWLTPLTNFLSRKYEYEADRFSVEVVGDKPSMSSALVTLCRENLSNLTPHPLYSFYHYTHPTTLERIRALID